MENLKEIFAGIEISEIQEKALLEFVDKYAEKKAKAITEEFEGYKVTAKKAFDLLESDMSAKATKLEKANRRAFAMLEHDLDEKTKTAISEAKKLYAENMVTALQEMYTECLGKAREDLLASPEFACVEELRKKMAITASSPEYKAVVEELEKYREENKKIEEEKSKLERDNIISSLCEDIPEKFQPKVKSFISGAKTNDEIYERFKAIAEVIIVGGPDAAPAAAVTEDTVPDADGSVVPVVEEKKSAKNEEKNERLRFHKKNAKSSTASVKDKKEEIEEATPVFESATTPSEAPIAGDTKQRFSQGFNEFESHLLNNFVFPQKKTIKQ